MCVYVYVYIHMFIQKCMCIHIYNTHRCIATLGRFGIPVL